MYNQGLKLVNDGNRERAMALIHRHIEQARQCGLFYYEVGETPQYYYWYGKSTDWKPTASGGVAAP